MADEDERIRKKAYELWEAEGQPEGRHDRHWEQAREIIALEDAGGPPTLPLDKTLDEPVEPVVAFENQGEFPGLADQGDAPAGPEREALAATADEKPLSTEGPATKPRTRKTAARAGEAGPAPRTRATRSAPEAAEAAPKRRKTRANGAGADAG